MKFAIVFVYIASVAYSMPTEVATTARPGAFDARAEEAVETTRFTIGLNATTTTTTTTQSPTGATGTTESTSEGSGTTTVEVVVEPGVHEGDASSKDNQQGNKTSELVDVNLGLLKNIGLTNSVKSQVLQAAKTGTGLLKNSALSQVTDKLGETGATALLNGVLDKAGSATGQQHVSQNVQNTVSDLLDIALNGNSILAIPGPGK